MRAALAVGLGLALLSPAAFAGSGPDESGRSVWQQRMRAAQTAVEQAEARLEAAERAYRRVRHRRRARGEAKLEVLEEWERARRALREAEQRFAELPEQARRAGVPPGWLRIDD